MVGRRGARIHAALRGGLVGLTTASSALVAAIAPAFAVTGEETLATHQIVLTASMIGVVCVAVASAVGMMRQRARADATIRHLRDDNADLKARADRAEALLDAEDQLILAWSLPGDPPLVLGRLGEAAAAPRARAEFLAFGAWLEPNGAAELDRAVVSLRERGTPFDLELGTRSGTHVEAAGRIAGGRPFVRFCDLTGERRRYAELAERHRRQCDEVEAMRALFEAVPMPMWLRGPDGRLAWVNRAYAQAVDLPTAERVLEGGHELLDTAGRKAIRQVRSSSLAVDLRLPVVVAGRRRTYDVVDVASAQGEAGIAIDVTDLEQIQAELRRTIDFHARTLDQLATAVATFGADKHLQFHNAAFRELWGLDPAFLDSAPEDGAVLDQMRAGRRLPEQADWRAWKRDVQSAYRSLEGKEHWWHLPDGQTLRVIANPHPQGGVTYVYENVTEKIELEKRHNALVRVQGETLDHLSEGVVVFGSDGRLRLSNPAFAALWRLDEAAVAARPHISEVIERLSCIHEDPAAWNRLKLAVTGLAENRDRLDGAMERRDGVVLEFAAVPLPDGATLVTFVNVTDTVNVERALMEKNEALEQADHIKTDFVGLVSYELRSPLTNIIGFAHLLADGRTGPLNDKQRDYTGHIMSSSQALMAIVDDILDLATIDAGIMRLQVGDVDVATTVAAAVEGVKDRLAAHNVSLVTEIDPAVGSFVADEKRVRQVLFNLLSNAVSFSTEGGRVIVSARRDGDRILVAVGDDGVGIPAEHLRQVFERFYTRRQGPHRGGAGLGLSIVKSFVELHGGVVEIESTEGRGTKVVCRFPLRPETDDRPGLEGGRSAAGE
ncbi:PAS domain-containing protein [Siculibacillus lacustris]|uniref:histidine kinase n=1 Tax=Siculibacillus lacustris TaxID=1549641 RepID=A0A4Q9VT36_9HYPH|nr:PAS domain-containing protein [Siculibacillus lacustris]